MIVFVFFSFYPRLIRLAAYFDRHKLEDVIEDKKAHNAVVQPQAADLPPLYCSQSLSAGAVICVFHDESTFDANADQSFHWTDESKQVGVEEDGLKAPLMFQFESDYEELLMSLQVLRQKLVR